MSAYALPGLFPPLLLENSIGISSACGSHGDHRIGSEKVDYKSSRTNAQVSQSPDVTITIKDAKINALQLIQSLTTPPLPSATTTQLSKKQGRRRRSPPSRSADQGAHDASPQEHAMQFELDVNYNGRRYAVVRSLNRMRLLREELVDELDHDCDSRQAACDSYGRKDVHCSLPELPSLQENGSYSNQSFSMLQALLLSYTPALERWLQMVFHQVSITDSPTLTHFLLEPICFLHSDAGEEPSFCTGSSPRGGTGRPGRNMLSLESIEELHDDYHED